MKRYFLLFLTCLGLLFFLTGCKGSNKIQGTWKAQDSAANNVVIKISKNKIKIGDTTYDYTQNAVGVNNGYHYYGLKINKKCIHLSY